MFEVHQSVGKTKLVDWSLFRNGTVNTGGDNQLLL